MTSVPWLSIIIPTYNEAENIGGLIQYLNKENIDNAAEIIIADGGSADSTLRIAKELKAAAYLSPKKGRANQMNFGAAHVIGKVLYFVHADCKPPHGFITDIARAVKEKFNFGRYQTRFDSNKSLLKINAFFTRFDWFICYGGDQTFFITADLFKQLNGYDGSMQIMEDYDIVTRAKKLSKYKIFKKPALISARKYLNNSWLTVLLANSKIIKMYRQGKSQEEMICTYKKLLSY